MSKLYKVICNAAAVECGVKIGDICSLSKEINGNVAWFHNDSWDDDGVWCLGWNDVEEIIETN